MDILFGIVITILSYYISQKVYKALNIAILNPILLSILMVIAILKLSGVDYEYYNKGGALITYVLGPIVVLIGISLYENMDTIKDNFLAIILGIFSGILTALLSVFILVKLLNIEEEVANSLYSKSITTPLAVEVTSMLGGVSSVTVVAVIATGIFGATVAPFIMKMGGIKSSTAKGIGIGTASHGVGTSKAIEMGEKEGAASGLAMGMTGVITVLCASIFAKFL